MLAEEGLDMQYSPEACLNQAMRLVLNFFTAILWAPCAAKDDVLHAGVGLKTSGMHAYILEYERRFDCFRKRVARSACCW